MALWMKSPYLNAPQVFLPYCNLNVTDVSYCTFCDGGSKQQRYSENMAQFSGTKWIKHHIALIHYVKH